VAVALGAAKGPISQVPSHTTTKRRMSSDSFKDAHSLLVRQLRRAHVSIDSLDASMREFLATVDSAYKDFDDDRQMLERSLDLSSQELIQANGELRLLLSERKKAAQQMEQLHTQRLEATGLLAGGVAHDFNNLLAVIQGSCDVLVRLTASDDPRSELLQQIDSAAKHASTLTRQLLAFSRRQVLKPRLIDLNATISSLESIIRSLIGQRIEVRSWLDPTLPPVNADPAQIEQVVLNLVVNARDAMPNGGRLELETARPTAAEVRAAGGAPGAELLRLSIKDTGSGMAPEIKARIFEPFFTTKGPGKGTGLGLSTVYGIVRQSGGFITVESEIGKGTTFHVFLPERDGGG
jgi:two-component system cell cycle sensor histidine kinase/response regulator CckA